MVVQGELFTAAEPTIQVILAALSGRSLKKHTTIDLLELSFQIISGASQKREEHSQSYKMLQDRVIACANRGLWLFYSFFGGGIYQFLQTRKIAKADQ